MQATGRPSSPPVRRTGTSWRWYAAWVAVGLAACVGIAGALTIGIFILPVVFVAAALLGVAHHTRTREGRAASMSEWTADRARSPSTNSLAKLSLVLGIASMVVSPPTAIAGVVTGVIARREIRRSGGAETGARLALAGIVTSVLGLAIVTVLLLALNRNH